MSSSPIEPETPQPPAAPPAAAPAETIGLKLGDLIQITAPGDPKLNDQSFHITYIDATKLLLTNLESLDEVFVAVGANGALDNDKITVISLLSRDPLDGYARQNGLLPGKWINIVFAGDLPTIITGEITNLEEDMIEVKTYPDGEFIYLDFAYQGLPQQLPLSKIELREPPEAAATAAPTVEAAAEAEEAAATEEATQEAEAAVVQFEKTQQKAIERFIIEADQIQIGPDLAEITQTVALSDKQQRFGLENQLNDMLDELLASVPTTKRTTQVLNHIHTVLERYKQLRAIFSDFDEYGNAVLPKRKTAAYKPLVETLYNMNQKLAWVIPVIANKKKLYDVDEDLLDVADDVVGETLLGLTQELETRIENYRSNNIPDNENKYQYALKTAHGFGLTTTAPEETSLVSADGTGTVLREATVETGLPTVTNNLENYQASVADGNDIGNKRYLMKQNITGLSTLEYDDKERLYYRQEATPGEQVYIKSLMMLPEYAYVYSKAGMPGTNMLNRAALDKKDFYYYDLLTKRKVMDEITVENLGKAVSYTAVKEQQGFGFMEKTVDFQLAPGAAAAGAALEAEAPGTQQESDPYKLYLNAIVPRTRMLFTLVKKYIGDQLSLNAVVAQMEPFMVYTDDLTYKQYQIMNKFINEQIAAYKKNYAQQSREFRFLYPPPTKILENFMGRVRRPVFNLLREKRVVLEEGQPESDLASVIFVEAYKILMRKTSTGGELPQQSASEILRQVIAFDGGELLMAALAKLNLPIMSGINITEVLERLRDNNTPLIQEKTARSACAKFVITKEYTALDDLLADNGREAYFDKNIDPTQYDILESYEAERESLEPMEFREFLVKKLRENVGLGEAAAERDAQAMIRGRRAVEEGEYAALKEPGMAHTYYYTRVGNEWRRDEGAGKDNFSPGGTDATNATAFCDKEDNCVQVNDKSCVETDLGEALVEEANLQQMLEAFDVELEVSKEELTRIINNKLEYFLYQANKLKQINEHRKYRINNKHLNYGMTLDAEDVVVSPYAALLDLILGQADIVKRHTLLLRFCGEFTRAAHDLPQGAEAEATEEATEEAESPYWLYCNKSGVKLVPVFLETLASVFVSGGDYGAALETICAQQGKISDDGDAWVDKHSGYVIKQIGFDTEEGYELSGFKMVSREVLEDDANAGGVSEELLKKYGDPKAEMVNNVISAMASYMGINLDTTNMREFVIRNTLLITNKIMPAKEEYQKREELAAKKQKKIPSYDTAFYTALLMTTLSYFLTGALIAVPAIRTRKQFPGCVKSFTGYPLTGDDDVSGLIYVACVANKIKSSATPWKTIKKMKEAGIAKRMRDIIAKYIVPDKSIQQKFREKEAYLALEVGDQVPVELDVLKWGTFLPPLKLAKNTTGLVEGLPGDFNSEFLAHTKRGSRAQYADAAVLRGKIIAYGQGIITKIQRVVAKAQPLLVNNANEPFLENACCFEDSNVSVAKYFIEQDGTIPKYNETVAFLSRVSTDFRETARAARFYSPIDTRRVFPELIQGFSEETIYRAFIQFCRIGSVLPVPEPFLPFCLEKPVDFDAAAPLKEQITMLKAQGKNYSLDTFQQLLRAVEKQRVVKADLERPGYSRLAALQVNIGVAPLSGQLIELLKTLITSFDPEKPITEDPAELRAVYNTLYRENEALKTQVVEFVRENSGLSKAKMAAFVDYLNNLGNWAAHGGAASQTVEDNLIRERGIVFLRNSITDLVCVFPAMVANEVDYKNAVVPRHWKLSQRHAADVAGLISKYYTPLARFYGDGEITPVLERVLKSCDRFRNFAAVFPVFEAAASGDYTVFNPRTGLLMMEHLVLLAYTKYIAAVEARADGGVGVGVGVGASATAASGSIVSNLVVEEEIGNIDEIDVVSGELIELRGKVSNLLVAMTTMFAGAKRTLNYSHEEVIDRVTISREKEKDQVTQRLKELSDEEREIETLLKKHKLGAWSKGLAKGITQYDQETYDEEREAMEKQIAIERELGQNDQVTAMNRDIYAADLVAEDAAAAAIEREEMDLGHLAEDDDYGDMDGDEFY